MSPRLLFTWTRRALEGGHTEPLAAVEFAKAAGFLRKQTGRTELLVPAARFQRDFPAHVAVLRDLRAAGWRAPR